MRWITRQARTTERATNKKASKHSKRRSYWRSYLDISFSLLVFTSKRKECQKGSGSESEHEYDDRVSLHADGDSELAGNINNNLGTNKESVDEDSDSGLKSLIQKIDKDKELGGKIKDLADIANKTLMLFKNSKPKWKCTKNHRTVLTYSWKKCNKEIWQERIIIKT